MRRWHWWLALAMWLLSTGACAAKHEPTAPARYIVLDDGLSSDVLVCVPLVLQTDAQHEACVPIDFLRWFLRSQTKG